MPHYWKNMVCLFIFIKCLVSNKCTMYLSAKAKVNYFDCCDLTLHPEGREGAIRLGTRYRHHQAPPGSGLCLSLLLSSYKNNCLSLATATLH